MIPEDSRLDTPEAISTPPPNDAKPSKPSRSAPTPQIVNSRFIHTASSNSSAAYLPYTTAMSRTKRSSALEVYESFQKIVLQEHRQKNSGESADSTVSGTETSQINPAGTQPPQPFAGQAAANDSNKQNQSTGAEVSGSETEIPSTETPNTETPNPDMLLPEKQISEEKVPEATTEVPRGTSAEPASSAPAKARASIQTPILQSINATQVPTYTFAETQATDPISLVENFTSVGKEHGAIKIQMGADYIEAFAKHTQLDPDTFTFKANKILMNPAENEINDRLKFYHDLINFHLNEKSEDSKVKLDTSDAEKDKSIDKQKTISPATGVQEVKAEPSENVPQTEPKAPIPEPTPKTAPKTRLPVFLTKLPMMDKRPLDLYDLFRLVNRKGGFSEVINKKWWAQIGRELGYKGKITSSLSSSLKMSYSKILYPLELHQAKLAQNAQSPSVDPAIGTPQNGELEPSKRRKLNSSAPLLLGSNAEFRRSVKLKSSKGLLLNDPHLMDLKTPLVVSVKDPASEEGDKKSDQLVTLVGAPAQINSYLKWLATFSPVLQDSSRLECDSKMATTYSLRQYLEKDHKFQEYLIGAFPQYFEDSEKAESKPEKADIRKVDDETFEDIFWQYLEHHSAEFDKLEHCPKLPSAQAGLRLDTLGQNSENPDFLKAALHPFNLPNIPYLPNSLLGATTASTLDNRDLLSSSFNIGMTFSAENWKSEDHFLQLCSFHFFGKSKRWFFIPESEFEKFEALIAEIGAEKAKVPLVNANYNTENWDYNKILGFINPDDETTNTQYECILNSLENVVNPFPEQRVDCGDEMFQKLIDRKQKSPKLNQEYLITPQLLAQKGINFTTTIQKPGEMIFKYPKTYSCAVSLGFNMSEEVNFASQLWLDYASEGEEWLKNQCILPNLSLFKILVNFAQLYESSENNIYFSSEVYAKVSAALSDLVEDELDLRSRVRRKVKVREVNIEERNIPDADSVSDDDLSSAFPSKIVITSSKNGANFIMSLGNFDKYIDEMEEAKKARDNTFPDLVKNSDYTFELHLFHSDEKLRTYQRSLKGYTADYESWMEKFEETFKTEEDVSLKSYRSLLSEGQKICSALSEIKDSFSEFCSGKPKTEDNEVEAKRMSEFKSQVKSLRDFVNECTEVIEQCQSILALKHQQRIRNGASENPERQEDESRDSLHILVDLVNKIPKLNFYTPEFDQIYEYRSEISNFDKACRQLIKSKNAQLSDLNDMISLGTSFGIKIPSLSFLIRLRDRILWMKTYEIIVAGGDPFAGKKEIFSIVDLVKFRDKGQKVLSSDDSDKLQEIEQFVAAGEEYDAKVRSYLAQNKSLNDIDLKVLDEMIVDMEDRSKLKGSDRLFVNLDTYQGLVDLKGQEKQIRFLQTFKNTSHNLFDTKQFLAELESCTFEYNKDEIAAAVKSSEEWLQQAEHAVEKVKLCKKAPSESPTKQACSSRFVEKTRAIIARTEVNFANTTVDVFEASSPYMFAENLPEDYSESLAIRYCICRDLEEGVMIECDKCHEWYHVQCVKEHSVIGDENDRYTCPACLVLDRFKAGNSVSTVEKITDSGLKELVQKGQELHVKPSVEVELLQELSKVSQDAWAWFSDVQVAQKGSLYKAFLYRKFIGAPLFLSDVVEGLLGQLKDEPSPFEDGKADESSEVSGNPEPLKISEPSEQVPEASEPQRSDDHDSLQVRVEELAANPQNESVPEFSDVAGMLNPPQTEGVRETQTDVRAQIQEPPAQSQGDNNSLEVQPQEQEQMQLEQDPQIPTQIAVQKQSEPAVPGTAEDAAKQHQQEPEIQKPSQETSELSQVQISQPQPAESTEKPSSEAQSNPHNANQQPNVFLQPSESANENSNYDPSFF